MIQKITNIVENWLKPGNPNLKKAVDRTIEEGLFSKQDIEFQLEVLRENVRNEDIKRWAEKAGLPDQGNATGKKVLCLHAGNLPLVGFQTALGVILTGADYDGKLSRKDPYLLASFLEEVKKSDTSQVVEYSTNLDHFENLQSDKVIFAGSRESVPEVKSAIKRLKAAKPEAEFIIRTAKFSIAYLDEWNSEIRERLTEAMCRYGGQGCRSVAMVVSVFDLEDVREELQASIQEFWDNNPQHQKPTGDLAYQYAYNEGIQRKQLWLEEFLIQETDELPEVDFTVNWVKGGKNKVRELRTKFGPLLQSVYIVENDIEGVKTEPLSSAQRPPLWWKPDGVDVIEVITLPDSEEKSLRGFAKGIDTSFEREEDRF